MPPHDRSSLSVGLTDVWPPSKDSCSYHLADTPHVHFEGATTSFAGVGVLSAPPWCVLSMLCNTTHVKTMSLTTCGLCSMVSSNALNLNYFIATNIHSIYQKFRKLSLTSVKFCQYSSSVLWHSSSAAHHLMCPICLNDIQNFHVHK